MNKSLEFFFEVVKTVILALVIVVPIRYFIFQPFIVKGMSMSPTLQNGDYLIVDELTYRFRDPARGEVVVFHYPNDPSERFVKRIIGLPGERIVIRNGRIEIFEPDGTMRTLNESIYLSNIPSNWPGNMEVTLGEDEYFVLGDNRFHSFDSRNWGPVSKKQIIGRVILRAWPFDSLAFISAPSY